MVKTLIDILQQLIKSNSDKNLIQCRHEDKQTNHITTKKIGYSAQNPSHPILQSFNVLLPFDLMRNH